MEEKAKTAAVSRRKKEYQVKTGRKFSVFRLIFPLFTMVIIALSVLGPELLARYKDRTILDEIHMQPAEAAGQGYRYALSSQEKIYILSEALSSQALAEDNPAGDYQQLNGNYAFVVNHRSLSEKEISDEEVFDRCNRELEYLKELGVLPETVMEIEDSVYDAVLYSAIDVLEPRNHVAVWELSLSNIQRNVNKQNRVIDVCMDADIGKIYEFYARTEYEWEDIDPDEIIKKWSAYQGLDLPVPYEFDNPLLETTPYFKKYMFSGEQEEQTIVTIGFYEGINELFLKVSH